MKLSEKELLIDWISSELSNAAIYHTDKARCLILDIIEEGVVKIGNLS